jgi:hypothetical protein
LGALVAVALVLPLAAHRVAARRVTAVRGLLRLQAPPRSSTVRRRAVLVAVPVLLGLAAAQPALVTATSLPQRTDAEAFFVIDVSRSMLAAGRPGGRSRFERARADARRLRDAVPELPAGIAGVSDRLLPYIFPTPDRYAFERTLQRSVGVDRPPPASIDVVSTSLETLGDMISGNFFSNDLRHRVVVVLTDGESNPVSTFRLRQMLVMGPRLDVVIVHVWQPGEAIFRPDGSVESSYHPDPSSAQLVRSLASVFGGAAFEESQLADAARTIRADIGTGPVARRDQTRRTRALAPYVALLALLPLGYGLMPGLSGRLRRR